MWASSCMRNRWERCQFQSSSRAKNPGMCLRSAIEISLITFIVWLWWSWSTRLTRWFIYFFYCIPCTLWTNLSACGTINNLGCVVLSPQHTFSIQDAQYKQKEAQQHRIEADQCDLWKSVKIVNIESRCKYQHFTVFTVMTY